MALHHIEYPLQNRHHLLRCWNVIFKINTICLYDVCAVGDPDLVWTVMHSLSKTAWVNAFSVSRHNILGFRVKLSLVSHITHQQCKDSVSVLNPLESPAAFLCLKHNVRLRPMHGAGKDKFDCQKLGGEFRFIPSFKACLICSDYRAEVSASFYSYETTSKKQDGKTWRK